jgi:hypothetical protein
MRVCLVLGAGASRANGLHFRPKRQRETLPPLDTTFFETVDAKGIVLSDPLQSYFRNFLGIEPIPSTLRERRMEEVFADVFFDFNEAPANRTALNAYIDLIELYVRILRENTNWLCGDDRGGPIGRLMDAARIGEHLSVVTFNHDLLIENEIHRRARLRGRWCLDRGYGSISSKLNLLHPQGGNPVFNHHELGECDHAAPIEVLKLHGSLNWRVRINWARPTAAVLRGEGTAKTHVLTTRRLPGSEAFVRTDGGRGRSRWTLWPVVVPPVYEKQALRGGGDLESSWGDARKALEAADRVVFFGYSLPMLDIEAEKLFERALTRNRQVGWIDVINPAPAAAARFAAIAPQVPMRWYPGLNEFLEMGGFSD